MNKNLLVFAAAVLLLSMLSADAQEPPRRGTPPSAAERQKRAGPWDQDVLVFVVGTNGTATEAAKFERAGVVTLARIADGRLMVAHQYFPENNERDFDKVAVHFSTNEGRAWTSPQVIRVEGLPSTMRFPFDPTLVPLPDGRIRLYFTSHVRGRGTGTPGIYSAVSTNGLDYMFEPGMRFGVQGRPVIDSAAVLHQGVFHLYSPDNGAGGMPGVNEHLRAPEDQAREGVGYHAVSKDGLQFERAADVQMPRRYRWLGNAQSDGKKITFYGTGPGGVWTATSEDGKSWSEPKALPRMRIADPGAVQLRDGSLLVVGSGPPRPGTPSAQNRRPPNP